MRKSVIKVSAPLGFVLGAFLFVACGGGTDVSSLETKIDSLQSTVDQLKTSVDALSGASSSEDEKTAFQRAYAGELAGTVVTMFGPVRGEEELTLEAAFKPFEDATGIDIQYTGTGSFESDIITRVNSGQAPDIADFPQPGLLQQFVTDGKISEVTDYLSKSFLDDRYTPAWVEASTLTGPDGSDFVAGVWHRTNGKSQVFYNKPAFEAAGYEIPTTYEELVTLSDQIKADGTAPWCFGIESGVATGWAATDWTEQLVANLYGGDVYDQWVAGDVKFSDPRIKTAIENWSELLLTSGNTFGGRSQIVSTFFGDAAKVLNDDPPGCYFHRQGNFITSFEGFKEATPGVDYDAFIFPPPASGGNSAYIVGGDLFAAFSDRPEVQAVMQFITTPDSVRPWLSTGGVISPHSGASSSWYGSPIDAKIADLINSSDLIRFDGSDLMPGAVGAGTFWTEITEYVAGTKSLDAVLKAIDDSWPAN